MGRIWLRFTDGLCEHSPAHLVALNYNSFCSNVLGSDTNDDMTFNSGSRAQSTVSSNEMGNSLQFIRRKVRAAWKSLHRDIDQSIVRDPIGARDGL